MRMIGRSRFHPATLAVLAGVACVALVAAASDASPAPEIDTPELQVERGRQQVAEHGCGDCHGGFANPAAEGFLAGVTDTAEFAQIGEFRTWARNLTPDDATGIGRFSERQIFNALRYGLRPGETPDVEITSATPGQGNFPAQPKYLAPPMPWPAWRHMSDQQLMDIAAYLKRGLKPVTNRVPDSEGPPDFWASDYTVDMFGTYPLPPFPAAAETAPPTDRREEVERGRVLVVSHACADCHGGFANPESPVFLQGVTDSLQIFEVGPFKTRPRNLTPDNTTGLGRFSERQIFNALRFGLRPGETEDVEITSMTPGEGNFPMYPKYLAPPMPWIAFRHMSDQELRDIAAYLKNGLRPMSNHVEDSEGPPDFWASEYTPEKIGTYPLPAFPTSNEVRQ